MPNCKVGFVSWPEGLEANTSAWESIKRQITQTKLDILVTNELPFGQWISRLPHYQADLAKQCVLAHEVGLTALRELPVPLIISSRALHSHGDRLVNEAFALQNGEYRFLHQKHFCPAEPGWHETSWFHNEKPGFEVADLGTIKVGVLLCTEGMFNEHARHYGKQGGAELIVFLRATGQDPDMWKTAGAMAAIVSGCYVVSSNRCGPSVDGPVFGGQGFAFAPNGKLIDQTPEDVSLTVIEIDPEVARKQKSCYPCYVPERRHTTPN